MHSLSQTLNALLKCSAGSVNCHALSIYINTQLSPSINTILLNHAYLNDFCDL